MKLIDLFEMTGGTTAGANFSPSVTNSGIFIGGSKAKLYKKKVKKESSYIKHLPPSTVGKTHSLTYGTQELKTFNTSQKDSASKFLKAMS